MNFFKNQSENNFNQSFGYGYEDFEERSKRPLPTEITNKETETLYKSRAYGEERNQISAPDDFNENKNDYSPTEQTDPSAFVQISSLDDDRIQPGMSFDEIKAIEYKNKHKEAIINVYKEKKAFLENKDYYSESLIHVIEEEINSKQNELDLLATLHYFYREKCMQKIECSTLDFFNKTQKTADYINQYISSSKPAAPYIQSDQDTDFSMNDNLDTSDTLTGLASVEPTFHF